VAGLELKVDFVNDFEKELAILKTEKEVLESKLLSLQLDVTELKRASSDNACSIVTCPSNSQCSNVDGVISCKCLDGFWKHKSGECRTDCGPGFVVIGAHCYHFSSQLKTQPEASSACDFMSGSLLTLETLEEHNVVASYMNSAGLTNTVYWMSLKKGDDGTWRWNSGHDMTLNR